MDPFSIAILLYIAALFLAFLDIFVPSGGMLVVLAVAAAFGAVLFGFRSSSTLGMVMLTIVAASIPLVAIAAINIWPHTPIGKRIILVPPPAKTPGSDTNSASLESLIGQVFTTESALLPAGQLKVGHRRLNAVVENGIVEVGQRVKVIAIRERNLVVRLTSEPVSVREPSLGSTAVASEQSETNLLELDAEELGLDSIED